LGHRWHTSVAGFSNTSDEGNAKAELASSGKSARGLDLECFSNSEGQACDNGFDGWRGRSENTISLHATQSGRSWSAGHVDVADSPDEASRKLSSPSVLASILAGELRYGSSSKSELYWTQSLVDVQLLNFSGRTELPNCTSSSSMKSSTYVNGVT
jgi:hypothetical protein